MVTQISTEDVEAELGAQFRRARLNLDLDQKSLAARANVAVGALQNLESGRGSTLRTLVRVARALDRLDWLLGLEPEPEISPIALLRAREQSQEPRRASPRRRSPDGTVR